MFRSLFAVPRSTPKPILRSDLGHLSVREKIHVKKLTFIHHPKNLKPESLGAEIYSLQVRNRFPGLFNECRDLIKLYQLPDIIDTNFEVSKNCWKRTVIKAVKEKSNEILKREFMTLSKLRDLRNEEENELSVKDYIKTMSLRNARTLFESEVTW